MVAVTHLLALKLEALGAPLQVMGPVAARVATGKLAQRGPVALVAPDLAGLWCSRIRQRHQTRFTPPFGCECVTI